MIVSIEEILSIKSRIDEINNVDIEDIILTDRFDKVNIDKDLILEFKSSNLSNIEFLIDNYLDN